MTNRDKLSVSEKHQRVAEAFGREADPLKKYEETFWQMEEQGIDPFELFMEDEASGRESTLDEYRRSFRHFREFIEERGRHPACPHNDHVQSFIRYELHEKGNDPSTVKTKIFKLNKAYEYFQREAAFPHEEGYNPFKNALRKVDWPEKTEADYPHVSLSDLREIISGLKNIRHRALALKGLKLGMRQGEIRNAQLQDIHITNEELNKHYPGLGSHPRIGDRENVIYIPSRYEREGNKSRRPRILPLDDEMRRVLVEYLLIRPDCGEPWLFLSQTHHEHIQDKNRVNAVWKEHIEPEIGPEKHHRPIRSHFGRHWFTTY